MVLLGLLGALASPVAAQTPPLSTDATLSGLELSEGRLDPAFATGTSDYTAAVGYTVTRITVSPASNDANAALEFLDGSDNALADADGSTDGFQVDLAVGVTTIKVQVTAEDGLTMNTYILTVTRTEEDTSLSPPASDPSIAFATSAVYRVTFTGDWTSLVTPGGVPGGAHFSRLVGAVHSANVTFVEGGETASAGVKLMAEVGVTTGLGAEVTAAMADALSVLTGFQQHPPDQDQSLTTTLTSDHPRVTLLSRVSPSPDWFVGVSGLLLLNSDGHWLRSHQVELYPWDAGTEDGGEFLRTNDPTVPPGVITSIRGTGKFSTEPIASLTFTLESVSTTRSVDENTEAGVNIGEPVVAPDSSGTVTSPTGQQGDEPGDQRRTADENRPRQDRGALQAGGPDQRGGPTPQCKPQRKDADGERPEQRPQGIGPDYPAGGGCYDQRQLAQIPHAASDPDTMHPDDRARQVVLALGDAQPPDARRHRRSGTQHRHHPGHNNPSTSNPSIRRRIRSGASRRRSWPPCSTTSISISIPTLSINSPARRATSKGTSRSSAPQIIRTGQSARTSSSS